MVRSSRKPTTSRWISISTSHQRVHTRQKFYSASSWGLYDDSGFKTHRTSDIVSMCHSYLKNCVNEDTTRHCWLPCFNKQVENTLENTAMLWHLSRKRKQSLTTNAPFFFTHNIIQEAWVENGCMTPTSSPSPNWDFMKDKLFASLDLKIYEIFSYRLPYLPYKVRTLVIFSPDKNSEKEFLLTRILREFLPLRGVLGLPHRKNFSTTWYSVYVLQLSH